MNTTNFERIVSKAPSDDFKGRKGAKLNKRNRAADRDHKREAFNMHADYAERKQPKAREDYREQRGY